MLLLYSCNDSSAPIIKKTTKKEESVKLKINAPTDSENGNITGQFGGCGYNTTPANNSISLYYARRREINQINAILKYSGLSSNFKIFGANIDNAIATIIDNQRYILYDPKLLSYTDKRSGNYWSSMSILAHEIGHHLSGHTIAKKGSNPSDELEADKFSGFVLYKLGATLPQALSAMKTLGSEFETSTHPAKARRLQAITKGWKEANETRYNSAIPPPPSDISNIGGAMLEFKTQNLLYETSYSELRSRNGFGSWVSDKWEGIITEADMDSRTYEIYITKVARTDIQDYEGPKKGDKVWISIYDPVDAKQFIGRAGLSWLYEIMIPGRRIQYAFGEEGTAPSRYFAYIKYLPAN